MSDPAKDFIADMIWEVFFGAGIGDFSLLTVSFFQSLLTFVLLHSIHELMVILCDNFTFF